MADVFIGLKRGVSGTKASDFTVGSSTTSALDFELRIADADDNGNPITKQDVMLALEALERYVASGPNDTASFPVL